MTGLEIAEKNSQCRNCEVIVKQLVRIYGILSRNVTVQYKTVARSYPPDRDIIFRYL